MTDESNNKAELDIFIANNVFPEAEPIFTARLKSLEAIRDDCYVVLDTNSLLVPYTIGKETLEQIKKTYKALADKDCLVVPAQVAREFAKNRANKISELYKELSKKRDEIPDLQKGTYPLLESLEEYQETMRLEASVDKLLRDYRKRIGKVLDHIRSWTWDDPVSLLYGELFSSGVVKDISIDKEAIKSELDKRQLHKIPPGYKDAGKSDSGIGDLLIWLTILDIGRAQNKSVIFVSGDGKPDWWHQSNKEPLYPRYELVDEFRRLSGGQSFHIITFSRFLNLYGASEKVVEEVRKEEKQSVSKKLSYSYHMVAKANSYDEIQPFLLSLKDTHGETYRGGMTSSENGITTMDIGFTQNVPIKVLSELAERLGIEIIHIELRLIEY